MFANLAGKATDHQKTWS